MNWDCHQSAWFPNGEELSSSQTVPGSGNVLRVRKRIACNNGARGAHYIGRDLMFRLMVNDSSIPPRVVPQINTAISCSATSGGEPYKLTFYTHDAFHPAGPRMVSG